MNAKTRRSKFPRLTLALRFALVLGIVGSMSPKALAFELGCGIYELTGRFEPKSSTLWLGEGTAGAMPVRLHGDALLTDFLEGSHHFYKIKVEVLQRIKNTGGSAEIISVDGLVEPPGSQIPYKKLKSKKCRST